MTIRAADLADQPESELWRDRSWLTYPEVRTSSDFGGEHGTDQPGCCSAWTGAIIRAERA